MSALSRKFLAPRLPMRTPDRRLTLPSDAPIAFFSYSRDDSEFALRLAKDLKAAGVNVRLDQFDLADGAWDVQIEKAVSACAFVVVILSPNSVRSSNVLDEVSFALNKQKRIIPVLSRDCDIPLRLGRLNQIDCRANYRRGLDRLLKALGMTRSPHGPGGQAMHPAHVWRTVRELVSAVVKESGNASVLHIDLDMAEGWVSLRQEILLDHGLNCLDWRCLMIDPQSPEIRQSQSESMSTAIAAQRIAQIQKFLTANGPNLKDRNLRIECRAYSTLPLIRGFFIAGKALFLSMQTIRHGRMEGSATSYLRFDVAGVPESPFIGGFTSWFDHQWKVGRSIWPSDTTSRILHPAIKA
jgi:hypothetical protein